MANAQVVAVRETVEQLLEILARRVLVEPARVDNAVKQLATLRAGNVSGEKGERWAGAHGEPYRDNLEHNKDLGLRRKHLLEVHNVRMPHLLHNRNLLLDLQQME